MGNKKSDRKLALDSVTFDEPHEVFLLEDDGSKKYIFALEAGRRSRAANWVRYTQVFMAWKVLGEGTVVIQPAEKL